jgi:hypothetical protein
MFGRNSPNPLSSDYYNPLPAPQTLTVGDVLWLWSNPSLEIVYQREFANECQGNGIAALERWANIELLSDLTLEAAIEFRQRLVKSLRKSFEEVNKIPLVEAVRLLDQPEAPSPTAAGNQGPPPPEAPAELPASENVEPVALGGPDDNVFVWGKEKDPLPPAQYRVVKALVEARKKGTRLSKDVLRRATKDGQGDCVEDPVGALERLFRRDKDWRDVIDMAKVPGRGYGLKDKPPRPCDSSRTKTNGL